MSLAAHIQNAHRQLAHVRTPEGGLLLSRADAIELLYFMQELSTAVAQLEKRLEADDTNQVNNVVQLFPK